MKAAGSVRAVERSYNRVLRSSANVFIVRLDMWAFNFPQCFFLSLSISLLFSSSNGISDKALRVIEEKEAIASRLASKAAQLFKSRAFAVANCDCSIHSCSYAFPGAQCDTRLGGIEKLCGEGCEGQLIDFNQTIVRTPPGTDLEDISPSLKQSICTYHDMESLFFDFYPEATAWTYIGTTDGHFRRWPATGRTHDEFGEKKLDGCRSYDPRTRPWYIAASTGPKDIVFILDKSGSMSDPQRGNVLKWNTTSDAVMALIDTLGTTDYFNIVAFSDEAEELWKQDSLAQGNSENKEKIKVLLQSYIPEGGTNFDAAFKLAFSLLTSACSEERKTCSGCEKVIIFLTDGKDTSRSSEGGIKPSVMASRLANYQAQLEKETSKRASIFTFSLGSDADDSIPRQIACNNYGAWSFIADDDDPLTAMRSYYIFLTARRRRSSSPIWTEPYLDDSGLGEIMTVAKPIFSHGSDGVNGVFLGVAGHDVFFSELSKTKSELNDIMDELLERAGRCEPFVTDTCQLQVLRNVYANEATCIDRFPIDTDPSLKESEDGSPCFTYGRSYYKRFSSLVDWDEARDRCEEDGGVLASVGSDEELTFLANMASDDGTWLGARRSFATFTWQEGSSPDLDYNSPYWGIGQPDGYEGVKDCVAIDTRGPSSNLNDARCDDLMTFICEYGTDESCVGEILDPRKQKDGYFTEPSLDLCVNAEASVAMAGTIPAAESLVDAEVVCPLGRPRPDAAFRCCPECVGGIDAQTLANEDLKPADDMGLSSALAIAITSVACIAVIGLCVTFVLVYRKQQKTVEPGAVEQREPTPIETSAPSATTYTQSMVTGSLA